MTGATERRTVTLFLGGDVMLGRGVDQIFERSCQPRLHEPFVDSALAYVELAERAHGPIPGPVDHAYVWGEALADLARTTPDLRIVNLETSVTTSEDREAKGIHYRMHPANVGALTAAGVDCATLANNHVLDWGVPGLLETLATLEEAGIRTAGAGRDLEAAAAPAVLELQEERRVLVFAFGFPDAGIPPSWRARPGRPGVRLYSDFSAGHVTELAEQVRGIARPRDIVVASIHWGGNWGYRIPSSHRRFAHALIDRAGVHLVHGHSSHHPRAIEVHEDNLILYGCGDLLTDYEGIAGREEFRDDLGLLYLPTLDAGTGELRSLEMTPVRTRRFRLEHPPDSDREWLRETLDRECRRFGGEVAVTDQGMLTLAW